MLDLEPLEEVHIFIFESLLGVMSFLMQNVVVNVADLRMAVRERPIAFLSVEPAFDPRVVIDKVG